MDYFKGILHVEEEKDTSEMYVSIYDDNLYYKVPRRILSFIDGCPSKVTHVEISYNLETERLFICASSKEEDKPRFTISINNDKILKLVELEGIKKNEDRITGIKSRQEILIRAISAYLKRNVQITEYDPLMFEEQNLMPNNLPKNLSASKNTKSPQ